jgi:hypothetical protein
MEPTASKYNLFIYSLFNDYVASNKRVIDKLWIWRDVVLV